MTLDDAADFRAGLGTPEEAAEVVAHLRYAAPRDDEESRAHLSGVLADLGRLA